MIIERLSTPKDLDAVLEIEDASFNNPTTREWYEGELKRPDVCFIYVLRLSDIPVAAFCAVRRRRTTATTCARVYLFALARATTDTYEVYSLPHTRSRRR